MTNYINNNKSEWNSSSKPWNISSNPSKNIDESAWNSSSNQCNSSSNTPKNIDEHSKQSSTEEESFRIIGTRPPISCHVSPISQNIVIIKIVFWKKRLKHNRQSLGQHDSSYYQPQPTIHIHRQYQRHDCCSLYHSYHKSTIKNR